MPYPSVADYLGPQRSRRDIVAALAPLAAPSNVGAAVFLAEAVALWLLLAGTLFLPELWMRVAASVAAGVIWINFIVIGHDAAHGSMAKTARWNGFIALYTLTHCAFHVRVWRWEHHQRHHAMTSSYGRDAWQPLSLDEYRAASPRRRWLERMYRMPTGLNFAMHIVSLRMPALKAYWKQADAAERAVARRYFWLQGTALFGYWAVLFAAPLYSSRGSFEAWGLGFALPYFMFLAGFGAMSYLQHTHVALPWYRSPSMQPGLRREDLLAASQLLPGGLSFLFHHVQFHAPHHSHPRIPSFRLKRAFEIMQPMVGPVLVYDEGKSVIAHLFTTLRRCKLYDYENHRWLDFAGRPTSERSPLAVANEALRKAPPAAPALPRAEEQLAA